MDTMAQTDIEAKKHWPKKEIYLGVLAIVFTIVLCVAAIYYKDDLMNIDYMAGYGKDWYNRRK